MNNINIKIKRLDENVKLPYCGSQDAAMWDLYANIDKSIYIFPHTTQMIGTGLFMEIPKEYWGGIFPRSGLASRQGLRPANCVGVIDSDYRGEIIVAIHNDSNDSCVIHPQERIAQFALLPKYNLTFEEVDELNETARGEGGFGSSGNK